MNENFNYNEYDEISFYEELLESADYHSTETSVEEELTEKDYFLLLTHRNTRKVKNRVRKKKYKGRLQKEYEKKNYPIKKTTKDNGKIYFKLKKTKSKMKKAKEKNFGRKLRYLPIYIDLPHRGHINYKMATKYLLDVDNYTVTEDENTKVCELFDFEKENKIAV